MDSSSGVWISHWEHPSCLNKMTAFLCRVMALPDNHASEGSVVIPELLSLFGFSRINDIFFFFISKFCSKRMYAGIYPRREELETSIFSVFLGPSIFQRFKIIIKPWTGVFFAIIQCRSLDSGFLIQYYLVQYFHFNCKIWLFSIFSYFHSKIYICIFEPFPYRNVRKALMLGIFGYLEI